MAGADLGTLTARLKLDTTAAEASVGRLGGLFGGLSKAALGLGAAYLGFQGIKNVIDDATKSFGDQQVATTLLNQALKDTGQKWTPALHAAVDTASTKLAKYGDNSAVVEGALQKLILRGVPATQAVGDLGKIANFAATAHLSLADATEVVTKAVSGRMSPALKELGATTLPKGVTGVDALNRILGQIAPATAGAADAMSHTMPGAMAAFGVALGDKVLTPLGALINKAMPSIISALDGFANWFFKTGLPALTAFAGWLATNIVVPFANIVKTVIPPVVTALGNIFNALNGWGVLKPIVGAVVALFVTWKAIAVSGEIVKMVQFLSSAGVASGLTATGVGATAATAPFIKLAGFAIPLAAAVAAIISLQQAKSGQQSIGNPFGIKAPFLPGDKNNQLSTPWGTVPDTLITGQRNPVKGLGGPIIPGLRYIVGDRGPEEFVSSTPGNIVPNNQLSRGTVVNLTMNILHPGATAEEIATKVSWALKTAAV